MGGPQGGARDAGKPQIHDEAPPRWTGVPVERDPVSGELLGGGPLGRGDKGRTARGPGRAALITAAAAVVCAAVAVTAFLVTRTDDDPAAAAGERTSEQTTTSAAPPSTTPPADTGPRTVPVTFTTTVVTPPPGFGPDPARGSVGDVSTATWTLTGPCDGAGPCELEQCDSAGCGAFGSSQPDGTGYVVRWSSPMTWEEPQCTGGTYDNTLTWAVSGAGDDITVTGSWVTQAAQVLFTGTDGRDCGFYLTEWSIASS